MSVSSIVDCLRAGKAARERVAVYTAARRGRFQNKCCRNLKPFGGRASNNEQMKIPNFLPILRTARIALLTWLATVMLATAAHAGGADSVSMATNAASPTSMVADSQLESSPIASKSTNKVEDPLIIKLMGLTIGLVAVVLGIGIGILAVWTEYKKRHDLITLCHQERMAALEKGLDLPPLPRELLTDMYHCDETSKPPSPHRGLKAGLMWLTIGIGTSIFLSLQQRAGIHPSIGLIPIGIGLVHLICYAIERRRNETRTVN